MSETSEHEENIAIAWFKGNYTEHQAKLSCELQGISFKNVENIYAREYENCEKLGSNLWN